MHYFAFRVIKLSFHQGFADLLRLFEMPLLLRIVLYSNLSIISFFSILHISAYALSTSFCSRRLRSSCEMHACTSLTKLLSEAKLSGIVLTLNFMQISASWLFSSATCTCLCTYYPCYAWMVRNRRWNDNINITIQIYKLRSCVNIKIWKFI